MRYNLGYMDKYPIEASGSVVENTLNNKLPNGPHSRPFGKLATPPISVVIYFSGNG